MSEQDVPAPAPADEAFPTDDEKLLPLDLRKEIAAVRGLATTYNLLDKMLVSRSQLHAIELSCHFIKTLYEDALTNALANPFAFQSKALEALRVQRQQAMEAERLASEAQATEAALAAGVKPNV